MSSVNVSKQGRARGPVSVRAQAPGVRASADSVVSQGRRAGQPRSARASSSSDVPRAPALASPSRKREGDGGFGRIQSVPSAAAADDRDAEQKRVRVVHQEKGPYRTIQAALAEALDGDIISVSPGVYAEQLQIERDNVRIVGKIRNGGEVSARPCKPVSSSCASDSRVACAHGLLPPPNRLSSHAPQGHGLCG